MNYFIDTNIAIAFSFYPDKHHSSSREFIINTVEDIYWSNNVLSEYEKKYDDISNPIKTFLNEIILSLENYNGLFFNQDSFEKFVLRNTDYIDLDVIKKKRLINIFWENIILGFFKEKEEFFVLFKEYALEVPAVFENNKIFLKDNVRLFDCGKENYKKYSGLLNSLIEIGVHNPDYKIILDAHDFAKENFTVFVSTDKKFLSRVMNFNGLNINEYKLLN